MRLRQKHPAAGKRGAMLRIRHNLMTILYALRGTAETHLARWQEAPWRSTEERLMHAEESLQRMHALAERGLALVKKFGESLAAPQKRTANVLVPVLLPEVWQIVLRVLRHELSAAKVRVIEDIPEDFPTLYCDRNHLTEIL